MFQKMITSELVDVNDNMLSLHAIKNMLLLIKGMVVVMVKTNVNKSKKDEELLKAFVGKNYDKILKSKFNFFGFFFTVFYMFYRKMTLCAFALFFVILFFNSRCRLIYVIVALLVGFFFNKFYLYYANKEIAKIKLRNPSKSLNELKVLCSSKGGTGVSNIIIGCLCLFAVLCLLFIIVVFTSEPGCFDC